MAALLIQKRSITLKDKTKQLTAFSNKVFQNYQKTHRRKILVFKAIHLYVMSVAHSLHSLNSYVFYDLKSRWDLEALPAVRPNWFLGLLA